MLGRDDTPWYQSLRLFRQDRPGDWTSVTDRAGTALARYLASPADASPMAQ